MHEYRHVYTITGVSSEDGRRRREQLATTIRKDKKEEGLAKRRNVGAETSDVILEVFGSEISAATQKVYTVADIPNMKLGLQSADVSVQVDCLRGFRRLLSLEKNSPVKQCIACGAVPLFVQFLQRLENTELQFEAAWVLTNIASSDETEIVVKCNAIPHLVNLLLSTNSDIREQVNHEDFSIPPCTPPNILICLALKMGIIFVL